MFKLQTLNFFQDESLFGAPRRARSAPEEKPLMDSPFTGRSHSASGPERKSKDKEVIQVITKDMIRKLR